MGNEILQEEVQTISDNQAVILEGEENSSLSQENIIHNTESASDPGEQIFEQTNEVLEPLPSISGNSVSDNGIVSGSDSAITSPDILFPSTIPLQEVQQTPFFESNINELSHTDSMLFLILCFYICIFVHGIFKGSHWFRRL